MRKLFILAALCTMLFAFSAEAAGIPLTKDNKNSRPLPKFIKIDRNKSQQAKKSEKNKKNASAESSSSFVGPYSPQMAAWIEYFEDDRRRVEYLKTQNYITESTEWIAYINKRLGVYLEYPNIFPKGLEKPSGAEGLWIQSSDGYVKLTVLDGYNTARKTAKDILEEILPDAKNTKIIKKKYGDGWYRLIYLRAEDTVHRYGVVDDYTRAEFILGYPNEKSDMFVDAADRMEETLRLVDAY